MECEVLYAGGAAEGVGVAMMEFEPAGFPAALAARIGERAATSVSRPDGAADGRGHAAMRRAASMRRVAVVLRVLRRALRCGRWAMRGGRCRRRRRDARHRRRNT